MNTEFNRGTKQNTTTIPVPSGSSGSVPVLVSPAVTRPSIPIFAPVLTIAIFFLVFRPLMPAIVFIARWHHDNPLPNFGGMTGPIIPATHVISAPEGRPMPVNVAETQINGETGINL
jgi:hypothetical protein